MTAQTNGKAKKVNKVLIAQDVYYPGEAETEEFYMSVLLDRERGRNTIVYSTEGGMDIEAVAEHTPEKIYKEEIDPRVGIQGFQARNIAFNLGLSGQAFKEMTKFVVSLYNAYVGIDASMFEINPVLKTSDNKIIAVDAKVDLDDNALFRHKELAEMRVRIKAMRQKLVDGLKAAGVAQDMSFITDQIGMFSYSGLSKDQMVRLRTEFGVYGTDTGRMCVAALNSQNIDHVCASIAKVIA